MIPFWVCQWYLRIVHMHSFGWSMVSSHMVLVFRMMFVKYGIFLWLLYVGLVRKLPCEFCIQSRDLLFVA